jgi:hypothetical protein
MAIENVQNDFIFKFFGLNFASEKKGWFLLCTGLFFVVSNFAKMRKRILSWNEWSVKIFPFILKKIAKFQGFFWEFFWLYLESDFNLKEFFFH